MHEALQSAVDALRSRVTYLEQDLCHVQRDLENSRREEARLREALVQAKAQLELVQHAKAGAA